MDILDCPYCGKTVEIFSEDCNGYREDEERQNIPLECPWCELQFVFTISISYSYEAEKADCLNGSDHIFQLTTTCPKEFSRMRCSICDEERELTNIERKKFNIGTKESYFEKIEKTK